MSQTVFEREINECRDAYLQTSAMCSWLGCGWRRDHRTGRRHPEERHEKSLPAKSVIRERLETVDVEW